MSVEQVTRFECDWCRAEMTTPLLDRYNQPEATEYATDVGWQVVDDGDDYPSHKCPRCV